MVDRDNLMQSSSNDLEVQGNALNEEEQAYQKSFLSSLSDIFWATGPEMVRGIANFMSALFPFDHETAKQEVIQAKDDIIESTQSFLDFIICKKDGVNAQDKEMRLHFTKLELDIEQGKVLLGNHMGVHFINYENDLRSLENVVRDASVTLKGVTLALEKLNTSHHVVERQREDFSQNIACLKQTFESSVGVMPRGETSVKIIPTR